MSFGVVWWRWTGLWQYYSKSVGSVVAVRKLFSASPISHFHLKACRREFLACQSWTLHIHNIRNILCAHMVLFYRIVARCTCHNNILQLVCTEPVSRIGITNAKITTKSCRRRLPEPTLIHNIYEFGERSAYLWVAIVESKNDQTFTSCVCDCVYNR